MEKQNLPHKTWCESFPQYLINDIDNQANKHNFSFSNLVLQDIDYSEQKEKEAIHEHNLYCYAEKHDNKVTFFYATPNSTGYQK